MRKKLTDAYFRFYYSLLLFSCQATEREKPLFAACMKISRRSRLFANVLSLLPKACDKIFSAKSYYFLQKSAKFFLFGHIQ